MKSFKTFLNEEFSLNLKKILKIQSFILDGVEDDRWDVKVSSQGIFKFEAPGKFQIGPIQLPNIDNISVINAEKELNSIYSHDQYKSLESISVNERELRVKGNVIVTFLLSNAQDTIDLLTNSTTFDSLNELIIHCLKMDDYEEIEILIDNINDVVKII